MREATKRVQAPTKDTRRHRGRATNPARVLRGQSLAFLCVSVSPWFIPDLRSAQPETPPPSGAENAAMKGEITPELDATITRGLAYLAAQQDPDGGFGGGSYGKNVAVTALACLAFMADGNLPGRGPYAEVVSKGIEYILANTSQNGLIAADAANGPMYGHGFATLFLGEVYGMTVGGADTRLSARLYEALSKAVRLIEQSQNTEGGWRYNPVPYDADTSVTICQIMALRSARNAGLDVPKATVDRAVDYVKRCQNPDGGFRYQNDPGASAWPRTAAGISSLYYAGVYEDEALERGLNYIDSQAPFPGPALARPSHFYYGHYYSVQAMYLAGGDRWAAFWPRIREELISTQSIDGAWVDPSVGSSYGTAMALIILQMPKRYLPIFQR